MTPHSDSCPRPRFLFRPLLAKATVIAAAMAVGACSGGDGTAAPEATSVVTPTTTSTTVGEIPPVTGTTLSPTSVPADDADVPTPTTQQESAVEVEFSVYWSRPSGQARPIDLFAYRDPEGGPYPYVLYGGITNRSDRPAGRPVLEIGWQDLGGRVQATAQARVVAPDGSDLAVLQPGANADFIVVIGDEVLGSQLSDLVPVLLRVVT
jgi:hypothetical protein